MMAIDSRLSYFSAALAIAAIVIPVSVYLMMPEPAPEPTTIAAQERHQQSQLGPGLISASNSEASSQSSLVAIDPWAPQGLEVTADQRLVLNKDMRVVFDYFLQPVDPGDRSSRLKKLQSYLKATLPPVAYAEAAPIAVNYTKYLETMDARNANQNNQGQSDNIPTSYAGIEQLKSKLAEDSRLRQSILGVNLAQLWFADEDAGVQRFLERRGQTPKLVISTPDQ